MLQSLFYLFEKVFVIFGIPLAVWIVIGSSFILTYAIRFTNITKFFKAFSMFSTPVDEISSNNSNKKVVPPLKAFFLQTASTLGIGVIAGSVFALQAGGPGVFVWILFFAIFFCGIKFSECVLGYLYRDIDENGVVRGGMFYVYKKFFTSAKLPLLGNGLSIWCAILTLLILLTWSSLQLNQIISTVFDGFAFLDSNGAHFSLVPFVLLVISLGSIFFILSGGAERTSGTMAIIVPFMVSIYLLIIVVVLILKFVHIVPVLKLIFSSAIDLRAIAAGHFSVLTVANQRLFLSTEAGVGSCAIAGSASNARYIARQGFLSFVDVMIVSLVMCAGILMLLLLKTNGIGVDACGTHYMKTLLDEIHPLLGYFFMLTVACFAFTTLSGNGYAVQNALRFLCSDLSNKYGAFIYIVGLLVFSILSGPILISFIDTLSYFLVAPNVILLVILKNKVRGELDIFLQHLKKEKALKQV